MHIQVTGSDLSMHSKLSKQTTYHYKPNAAAHLPYHVYMLFVHCWLLLHSHLSSIKHTMAAYTRD
jgi:hypothetical protein